MQASEVVQIINTLGVPTAVLLWFMLRLEKKLDMFTENTNRLILAVKVMAKALDVDEEVE